MSRPWWWGAVIYQVYVRSAADGNGDGVGDLIGLRERLPYFTELGVDALWLSPIYPSGGIDGGYDVVDYDTVDTAYGGPDAFDALIVDAHAAGLKLLLDFVPNHTSERHPWFAESRSSRNSPKRDWYLWADPAPGGGPPNNWRSAFGGPGWTFDPDTGQYYCTSFYPQQVDLNWRNTEVRTAVEKSMLGWVQRGADGFRLDVVMKLAKDPELKDDPPDPLGGVDARIPIHSENHPDGHAFVREIREALGANACLLGEVWLRDLAEIFRYLQPGELDLAFNFPFAFAAWDAHAKAATIELAESLAGEELWPCYHLSNHDVWRHASVIGMGAVPSAAILLLTLRGTPVLYQGEELGMENVDVPPSMRHDEAGRDVARTPMQWDASPHAGFCPPDAEPWLPVADDFERRNVAVESADPDSVLSLYRRMLAFRRGSKALRLGSFRRVPVEGDAFGYVREAGSERLLVVVNFGGEPVRTEVPRGTIAIATLRAREGERVNGLVRLGANEGLVVALDS